MNTTDEKLKAIRQTLEGYYLQPSEDANRPLPARNIALDSRLEYALNVQRETEVAIDTSKFVKQIDKIIFRIRYRVVFHTVSLIIYRVYNVMDTVTGWLFKKSQQWGRMS